MTLCAPQMPVNAVFSMHAPENCSECNGCILLLINLNWHDQLLT